MCEHLKFITHFDIGFDVSEDGDERQHLDICETCKAKRFWCDYTSFISGKDTYYSEWEENTPDNFWNAPIHFGRFN